MDTDTQPSQPTRTEEQVKRDARKADLQDRKAALPELASQVCPAMGHAQ